jgi:hypothetical protein
MPLGDDLPIQLNSYEPQHGRTALPNAVGNGGGAFSGMTFSGLMRIGSTPSSSPIMWLNGR